MTALEQSIDRVRSEVIQANTKSAMTDMWALSARQALGKVQREVDMCRGWLTQVRDALLPSQKIERDRVELVMQRLDCVRETVDLEGSS